MNLLSYQQEKSAVHSFSLEYQLFCVKNARIAYRRFTYTREKGKKVFNFRCNKPSNHYPCSYGNQTHTNNGQGDHRTSTKHSTPIY